MLDNIKHPLKKKKLSYLEQKSDTLYDKSAISK